MLNFSSRTSDKAAYKSPTRGAQGNALKTIVGIAHNFNGCVMISAQGAFHVIIVKVTPVGIVEIQNPIIETPTHIGTQIMVVMNKGLNFSPAHWAYATSLFNPHARVKMGTFKMEDSPCLRDAIENTKSAVFYPEIASSFKKHNPNDATSIRWYDKNEFYKLAYLISTQTSKTLNQFVHSFDGLTG